MGVSLSWSASARVLEANAVGGGALPLEAVDPRDSRFAGYYWRVRVSGCEGSVYAGPANRATGDAVLEEVAVGEWSRLRRVSHDDLLAVQSSAARVGCPTVIAEHELVAAGDASTLMAEGTATGA
ncbi:MAG: hypothetical protein KDB37_23295, partial [Ilumatobacter sp.]|nr:hypothetical protein [Ilumatobacter sp.]